MKNSRILLAIAVVICFYACGSLSKTQANNISSKMISPSHRIDGYELYKNEWYSIQYPSDWKFDVIPKEFSVDAGSQHLALCMTQDTSEAIQFLKIDIRDEKMSFLELFNIIKSEQDTASVIKIGEQECILSFNSTPIEEDVIFYSVEFRFVKNNHRYVLIFMGNERIFEKKNLSLIGSIARTFVIK